ncbi:MAG: aminoacetone oxidase family FAD-binding enzyme [Bacilli bacterium]|nr:aminoacetone oxidase family FAD-binding enzyme [Bacilli bacterium]
MSKVIVIGGGASGLVAAITAARSNNKVIIIENNNSCGKKILVTGNGKCNYFNEDMTSNHYDSYNKELIDNIINNDNKRKVLDFFNSIGIIPIIKNGYYYPHSNQAITILNALMQEIKRLRIEVIYNTKVTDIKKINNTFEINTNNGLYKTNKLIIATGSYAYYKDDVNSYKLLSNFNHSIIKPLPALVQLKIDNKTCKKWGGVRVNSTIRLYEDDKYIKEEEGELMLTNYGISGICAMQLSGIIAKGLDKKKKEEIIINFIPDIATTKEELLKFLDNYNKNHNFKVSEICDNLINYKLGNALNKNVNDLYYNNLSKQQKSEFINNLINYKVKITGTNSFKEAQTCSGGIPLTEINLKTMESLKINNLYFTGEIIDISGECGGYNLGLAWISGLLAGGAINDKN